MSDISPYIGADQSVRRMLETMRHIRVLLADDERLLRAGIRLILQQEEDIDVVAEAEDSEEAVKLACQTPLDVVLIDIRMPGDDGLAAIEQIARRAPAVKVVVLTTSANRNDLARALRAGATGFILKDIDPQNLIRTLRVVAHGDAVLSPQITKDLIKQCVATDDSSRRREANRVVSMLTTRERDVLVHIGLGAANAEIARQLFMGEGTVKTYVSRILEKLGCDNRVQAAIIANEARILPTS
ncbi:response regulator [Amycolatopsis sp. NPDC058986]|uniref:response regulator n=1 Tax=unclassified Amycolatopsis TaxID=2618356 RepID=UPI00366EED89